ncbi:MAG: DUF3160 domain-containing protein [bacterium]
MFINKDKLRQLDEVPTGPSFADFFSTNRGLKIIAISLIALGLLAGLIIALVMMNRQADNTQPTTDIGDKTITPLPTAETVDISSLLDNDELNKIKAEDLLFGDFYREPISKVEVKNPGIQLPMNVKRDADNYYDFTRYINLDDVVDDLNINGFAVIDNPYSKEAKDFYSVYKKLQENKLPLFVSNDFLIYYYQNTFKNLYKRIEADVFYQSFWDINKELFTIADKRYRERLIKVGILNDPLLEAQRLEAAYFATSLALLTPNADQILGPSEQDYVDPIKFTQLEAERYSFTIPDYLQQDVASEVKLIITAKPTKTPVQSPALRYYRYYDDFKIPAEYYKKAKLYNFYLANVWANSVFPLFFKSEDCPDCLLDRDDWEVSFIAAHLVAQDFENNQTLKNKWAKIYKTISYFTGLRNELTYLHYRDALHQIFGKKATVEEVLTINNLDRDTNLVKLYNQIKTYTFNQANGGYDRQIAVSRSVQGLRLLQQHYWPDDYVFNQLLFDPMGNYINYNPKTIDQSVITICSINSTQARRCRPTLYDIVRLVFTEPVAHPYINKNSNYQYYDQKMGELRKYFSDFDSVDWHNSSFWSTVLLSGLMLQNRQVPNLGYTDTAAWTNQLLNTSAGAIFNVQMPVDSWQLSYRREASLQTNEDLIIKYNFIEPNITLLNELLADTYMLFKTMYHLDLVKANDNDFSQLINNLITLKRLASKQLNDQEFTFEDWRFLNEFTSQYYINDLATKTVSKEFINSSTGQPYNLQQSLDGVKLLISVQYYQNRQILAVGPIFNYQEAKK